MITHHSNEQRLTAVRYHVLAHCIHDTNSPVAPLVQPLDGNGFTLASAWRTADGMLHIANGTTTAGTAARDQDTVMDALCNYAINASSGFAVHITMDNMGCEAVLRCVRWFVRFYKQCSVLLASYSLFLSVSMLSSAPELLSIPCCSMQRVACTACSRTHTSNGTLTVCLSALLIVITG
jgi:hypothetical protein